MSSDKYPSIAENPITDEEKAIVIMKTFDRLKISLTPDLLARYNKFRESKRIKTLTIKSSHAERLIDFWTWYFQTDLYMETLNTVLSTITFMLDIYPCGKLLERELDIIVELLALIKRATTDDLVPARKSTISTKLGGYKTKMSES